MTDVYKSISGLWNISNKGTTWLCVFSGSAEHSRDHMLVCPIYDLITFIKAPYHKYNLVIPKTVWDQIVKTELIMSPPKLFKTEIEVQAALGLIDDPYPFNSSQESVWEVNIDYMSKWLEYHPKNKEMKTNEVR